MQVASTRDTQRFGPVRERDRLAAALTELQELDRVRVSRDGSRRKIEVNPALVGA